MSDFKQRTTTKKGDYGEDLVNRYLLHNGCIPYIPIADHAHPFDRLCVNRAGRIFIAEVKSKARRNRYPDTGINVLHYEKYKQVRNEHNLDVFIIFVDEMLAQMYGNWLRELERKVFIWHNDKQIEYPLIQGGIIYFPYDSMIIIKRLSRADVDQLKELSTRSYGYEAQGGKL